MRIKAGKFEWEVDDVIVLIALGVIAMVILSRCGG